MNRNNPYTSLSSIIESFVMLSEIIEILKIKKADAIGDFNIETMTILQYHPYFKFVDSMKNYH